MTDIVRQLAPQIKTQIDHAKNILLHFHPTPDPDSAGSALAVMEFLKNQGKQVAVIGGDSEVPASFACFPGSDQIIPKNYFQIDISQFDLFIILDASSPGQVSKMGDIVFPPTLNTIAIDHHSTNNLFAQINLVDTSYPATGQIIYDLFSLWGVEISKEMAVCLYLAIYTDTGGFKYPLTNNETLEIAAKLAKINPDFPRHIFTYENSNDPQHILYIGLALHSVKLYFSGQVAISAVSYPELQRRHIRRTHTEKMEISNYLKSVIGWNIGIALTEYEPGMVNLSFRTRDSKKYNVAKIAQAIGNGGGHPVAAGATLKMPIAESLKYLLDTIQKTYPDLGHP
jgi:bifunctional oligoribonuclease and PAP phosphatase NrnA